MSYLEPLMQKNFLKYASYVIVDRAIPDIRDGCKPVQRRILETLHNMDDGKFHKVANIIGETMKLHPHGDASIGDALVVLANKEYFIEKQGNFGNITTGHPAAAARYIECRLTDLARDTLFNPALTTYQPSYDGRRNEPVFLPVKLPVVLLLGIEGIAVGLATKVLPHNLRELLNAQIKLLQGESVEVFPDFPQGGMVDVSEYSDGRGRVRVRARIEARGEKKVVISEIPHGTTTESLISSIESAAQKNRVKISAINDFTTDHVEIELSLSRGVYADEVIPQLYAYTDCEVSISSNIVVICDNKPIDITVSQLLQVVTSHLRERIRAELEYERSRLEARQHWLTLEQIFIENRVYKRIEKATTKEAVARAVVKGMEQFAELFIRDMTDEDLERLLNLQIRRISAFDINRHRQEMDDIIRAIKRCNTRLRNLTKTTIGYLQWVLDKYGSRFPRRTEIEAFASVDRKAVARQNVKVSYDRKTGFFGSDVRGKDFQLTVTEYDVILVICRDGTFRVLTTQPKVLLTSPVLYCDVFSPDAGAVFTMVYRDMKRMAFAKKFHIQKFIRNKEYELIKGKQGKIDLLLREQDGSGKVHLTYSAGARQKVRAGSFNLDELPPTGVFTRGTRLATKPVAKIAFVPTIEAKRKT